MVRVWSIRESTSMQDESSKVVTVIAWFLWFGIGICFGPAGILVALLVFGIVNYLIEWHEDRTSARRSRVDSSNIVASMVSNADREVAMRFRCGLAMIIIGALLLLVWTAMIVRPPVSRSTLLVGVFAMFLTSFPLVLGGVFLFRSARSYRTIRDMLAANSICDTTSEHIPYATLVEPGDDRSNSQRVMPHVDSRSEPTDIVRFQCPECGKKLRTKSAYETRRLKCPACGTTFTPAVQLRPRPMHRIG